MQLQAAAAGDNEQQVNDLGPLAWVLDELRKSLDGATKAIRRFVRDAELARGSDLESLDASQLRIARQQLHQAVGALEMVGLSEPAKVLRAMEALAQKFVQRPEFCSEEAANKVERASFALIEYLEAVLRGKTASAIALFPQYRDVLELAGEERIHPAELWAYAWHWVDPEVPGAKEPLAYDPAVRAQMDAAALKVVKSGSVSSAKALRDICLGLAAAQKTLEVRAFWKISAAYFEALALKLCPSDVYVKRAVSRVLMQYTTLARGKNDAPDRLAQDILFFCAQAVPPGAQAAPVLSAIRQAYGLNQTKIGNYEVPQYGRFDPAVLAQARKRIATATETWSALSGGDTNRLKVVSDQFGQVGESLLKLHAENKELARALQKAVDVTIRSGEPPTTPVAMEVATAILYLDAAYEDMDPTEVDLRERSDRLARRLDHVVAGGQPEPLEPWMEELYRRVSDRQTMGSVVEELRTGLTEIEKSLDTFFRNPQDKTSLNDVPNQLAQMRGVFSVLGLDQASLATVRMRDTVEKFLIENMDEATIRSGAFEKFGNSLGALGFLIDMLSYQRVLAKKLFVYDEALGEFKPLMGREREAAVAVAPEPAPLPTTPPPPTPPAPRPQPVPAAAVVPSTAPAPAASLPDDDGAELRDIFLEEAREVVRNGQDAVAALVGDPADLSQQTTLRRAFHTLKGSSRMVGFTEFGEAAWAMEQMMNSWLAEQKPARPELLQLSGAALQGLGLWVEDIAHGADAARSAVPFRQSADAMRLEGLLKPLVLPESGTAIAAQPPAAVVPEPPPPLASEPTLVLELAPELSFAPPAAQVPAAPPPERLDFALTEKFELDLSATEPLKVVSGPGPVQSLELSDVNGIDFSSLGNVPPVAEEKSSPTPSAEPFLDWVPTDAAGAVEPPLELPELQNNWVDTSMREAADAAVISDLADFALELEPAAPSPVAEAADEQIKVIGPLRIGIPLYNVYLNEADEWSRRLVTELNEWALELHNPLPDSSIALAHSLGGSSATVGFSALSEIARMLEQAMQHVQLHGRGLPEHARIFVAAADEVRHLLHQFAAGFLKAADPDLISALNAVLSAEFTPKDAPESGAGALPVQAESAQVLEVSEIQALDMDDLTFDLTMPAAATPAAATAPAVQPLALNEPLLPASAAQPVSPARPTAPAPGLPGAAQLVAEDTDKDIDAVDVIDPDLFPIFEEEAAELMPQLGSALRQWSAQPDNAAARLDVLRVLHTLKGSARLAGAMRLGEMAHRLESAIEYMGTEYVQSAQIEPMLGRFDRLQHNFDELCHGPVEQPAAATPNIAMPAAATPPTAAVPSGQPVPPARVAMATLPSMSAVKLPPAMAPSGSTAVRSTTGQTVRVRSQLLDRLVNQAGEVMITRSRLDQRLGQLHGSLGELTTNLDRLRVHLRDVEMQAESQMQSRLQQAKDTSQGFDPLEFDRFTHMQELTRMMAESVNDVATVQRNLQQTLSGTEDDLIAQARQTRELQRDLLRTRMMEFEGISDRLYGVVRQAAKDAGKQVRLDIQGGTMELDRGVLDRMAPAFEHMLRNAVAHGIEAAQDRLAAGKAPAGIITIALHQEGNDVSVVFSDDGAGLNLARIREKAQAQGLIAPGQLLPDAEAANMIFMPGFSTASSVTELAGRGIGMDVVRSEVQALGGRIEIATQAGMGTSFKLVLPLTTAVTQVIMLRMGELNVGVPANLVEIVRRLNATELDLAYHSGSIPYGGEVVPFFWAGALLQASSRSQEHAGKTHPVVVLRSAGQRVGVHVDEVLGNQEVVVKNLGPQLSRLPGLAGMSVLASGAVVLIYNPVALATVYGARAQELQHAAGKPALPGRRTQIEGVEPVVAPATSEVPLVLVVDDSITVRRVTQRLLRREGYRVALAADGLQALERLAEERPSVVLSDIEMPRMDGFDLVRNIRNDAKLRDLPVIMITSRIAEKHREHARELGVSHYLGKPFSEEELLSLVRQYCAQTVPS